MKRPEAPWLEKSRAVPARIAPGAGRTRRMGGRDGRAGDAPLGRASTAVGHGPGPSPRLAATGSTKLTVPLEEAFQRVAARREPAEGFHFGVNSLVRNATFALYRDFPEPFRHRGEERF